MRSNVLLVITAASLAACSGADRAAGAGSVGGTMVVAGVGDAGDLFPPLVIEENARMIQDQLFDRLAEIGPDMSTVGDKGFTPRLARSWTWAADSLSIAFNLDPRARWHDGTPVRAADVRYSFRTDVDPAVASPIAAVLGNVDSVSVKDSLTAVVWYKKRTPEQFFDVVYNLVPFPEHVYGSIPAAQLRTSEGTRTIVGSGRFRLVKWEPKVRIELLADTANYRGRAKLDRIIITPISDPAAGVTQILTGQADFMSAFPIDQVPKLDSSTVARPLPLANFGYVYAGFNPHARKNPKAPHPIFSDIRVRRALAMALDRQSMLQNVFGNLGRIGHGPFPMTLSAADSTIKLPPYDTAAARALLDSAGWVPGPDGVRVRRGQKLQFGLVTPQQSLFRRRYAVLIQEQLRKLGVVADIETLDNSAFMSRLGAADFDVQLGSYVMDPSLSSAKQNWASSAIGAGGLNMLFYANPNVDALLDSATTAFDPATAKGAATRAFQAIVDDVPAVFLYDIVTVQSVNRRFDAAPTRPDGWWVNLADWSVPAGKRIDRDKIGLAPSKP